MNWLERINTIPYEIITGDTISYFPKWKNAVKNINFNHEGFDFINVAGTNVSRKKVQGAKYPIEFFFDSEDHVERARSFENSASNPRPWTIIHPIFGEITCEPLALSFDSTKYNVTRVTGVVWETLNREFPVEKESVSQAVIISKGRIDEAAVLNFEQPLPENINTAAATVDIFSINYEKLAGTNEEAIALKQLVSNASSSAQELIQKPIRYISSVQALINFPFASTIPILSKLVELDNSIGELIGTIKSLTDYSNFEATSASLVSVACSSSVVAEFSNKSDVLTVIDFIKGIYSQILNVFESSGVNQNQDTSLLLDQIIFETIGNLLEIALDAPQERSIILEKDSNPIILANRFYGSGDDSLDRFISENKIPIGEMLQIKKGRSLIWYV